MEKRISFRDFQSVKAVAKAIDPHLRTIATLQRKAVALKEEYEAKQAKVTEEFQKKASKITEEYNACETQINALEAGILSVTGFHVADLVKKVIEPNGKTDKNGKPLKETKYLATDIVSYDEVTKEYVIAVPDENNEATKEPEETVVPDEEEQEETLEEEVEANDSDDIFI